MRELTYSEITSLAEEIKILKQWESAIDTAKSYFIGEVASVKIMTNSEYNDDGGSREYITAFEAFDKDGNMLPKNRLAIIGHDDEEADVNDYWSDTLSDIIARHGTYHISSPPKLSHSKVFVD
jgi:hypothetical protein